MAVTLRDFMSSDDVLTIEAEATLGAAARKMRQRNVGAAVVVDGEGAVTGIFTERDLLRAIADSRHPDVGQVQSYMTTDPITLPPDHLPSEAARIMSEGKFRHIPVVDDGRLVGVVSIRDLMQAGLRIHRPMPTSAAIFPDPGCGLGRVLFLKTGDAANDAVTHSECSSPASVFPIASTHHWCEGRRTRYRRGVRLI